jgi:hypothetical protein
MESKTSSSPKPHKLRKRYTVDKKKKSDEKRKVFYYYDDPKKPILAGGIILINKDKDDNYIFLQQQSNIEKKYNNQKLSDFGGKTEFSDKSIADTITREFNEETNYEFYIKNSRIKKGTSISDKEFIHNANEYVKKHVLSHIVKSIYVPKSKYLLFICYLPDRWKNKDYNFGEYESTDKIEREALWISIEQFFGKYFKDKMIHPRLWNGELLGFLTSLRKKRFGFSTEK